MNLKEMYAEVLLKVDQDGLKIQLKGNASSLAALIHVGMIDFAENGEEDTVKRICMNVLRELVDKKGSEKKSRVIVATSVEEAAQKLQRMIEEDLEDEAYKN